MNRFETSRGKPRFINPPNTLKQKVGTGGIPEENIQKSEAFIKENKVDFTPYAQKFLEEFSVAAQEIRNNPEQFKERKDDIINPVMQLKANGAMFRYDLVTEVADIGMQFLEVVEEINEDSYAVITAFQNTLNVIISNKLTGNGGKEGYALVKELDEVCKRYFKKHKE